MRYDPLDYLYVSARIRAMEGRLTGREKLNQLLEMSSAEEILDAIAEKAPTKNTDREALPEEALREAFRTVAESVPDKRLLLFLQYPYDCNNLKALEKCRHKGISPDAFLTDLGSIPVKTLTTVSEKELFTLLPPHMAAAVEEVRDAFAKTANPQEIDFILDRAAYADMAEAAAPFPFAAEWVRTKADLVNLTVCLRLLRMQDGASAAALLPRIMLPGGSLDEALLTGLCEGGEDTLCQGLFHTPYGGLFEKGMSLSEGEKRVDDYLMALTRRVRAIPFGAEVPIAYLLAAENQSKNLRILLAGKRAGQEIDTIKSKMRESYV